MWGVIGQTPSWMWFGWMWIGWTWHVHKQYINIQWVTLRILSTSVYHKNTRALIRTTYIFSGRCTVAVSSKSSKCTLTSGDKDTSFKHSHIQNGKNSRFGQSWFDWMGFSGTGFGGVGYWEKTLLVQAMERPLDDQVMNECWEWMGVILSAIEG